MRSQKGGEAGLTSVGIVRHVRARPKVLLAKSADNRSLWLAATVARLESAE